LEKLSKKGTETVDKRNITQPKPVDIAQLISPHASASSGIPSMPGGLSVAMLTPEAAPFAKTGGLGDVLGALPRVLEQLGLRVSVIMPAYRSVLQGKYSPEDTGFHFTVPISSRQEEGTLLRTKIGRDINVYFIRADKYFDREYPYGTPEGDYPDNAERFVFFSRAALEVLRRYPHDILHAHDWQSALAIAFLKAQPVLYPELSSTRTVFTVHNLGYQGVFWYLDWHLLNLDWSFFTPQYLEFYRKINFLKGGLVFADAVTTVSPSYAEEIKTAEQGCGLEGVFEERAKSLAGILNGVDYTVWSPETDPFIAQKFSSNNLSGKKACKAALQRSLNLPENPEVPLIGMVSRLSEQKGFDLIEKVADELLWRDLQVGILGTGEKKYRSFLSRLARSYPDKVGVSINFDESLAHQIMAGSDMLLMPSRYEPGGLTQLYALKYGTIPVVRATGGLKDTIQELDLNTGKGNGFIFRAYEPGDFLAAVNRALAVFALKIVWQNLTKNAMSADFSWEKSGRAYVELYRKA
jgi:starch synthase